MVITVNRMNRSYYYRLYPGHTRLVKRTTCSLSLLAVASESTWHIIIAHVTLSNPSINLRTSTPTIMTAPTRTGCLVVRRSNTD